MKKSIRAIFILFTLALFLGACLPAAPNSQEPQAPNTQSPQDVQSQVETAVAQTVEAQNQIGTSVAQTIAAQATPTFTPTLVTLPTLTPFVVSTPTSKPVSGGGAPAKPDYACDFIRLRPTAYTEINRGQKFDIKMTIVNTGTRSWYQGYDLKYSGGAVMTTTTFIELPAMAPGDQYQVVLDAVAPTERGNQTMTWMVEGQLCFGYVVITVK